MFRKSNRRDRRRKQAKSVARPTRQRLRIENLEDRIYFSAASIIAENALQGTPQSVWDLDGTPSDNIQGFATQTSINHGETIQFKIDTDADDYRIDIFRLGYYGGNGARLVTTINPNANLANNQPDPKVDYSLGLVDAGNWKVSASWTSPATAVSGVYIAKLTREDGVYGENQIIFVVRDDEGHSDMLFQTSDSNWQAYNTWGGSSFYSGNLTGAGRSFALSYNRPYANLATNPLNYYFAAEYPMTRFLEQNGYDVSYTSTIDTSTRPEELLEHKIFMSVGHDEYWTGDMRTNVEAARDAGVNLTFFSGNEVFWKTRLTTDAAGNANRTLVCYKETMANAKIDPLSDVWTGTWRDPRFSSTTDGGVPENSLTGTIFTVNSNGDLGNSIDVGAQFAAMRFWRNTAVASLTGSKSLSLGDRVLGYEWDEDLDNGYRPAGLITLSSTTLNVGARILDYGSNYGPGTATHSLVMYRAPSGALVFGAGTIQYSWALDSHHDIYDAATDKNIQQATINLFADMGAQPGSLMSGMIRAFASTDTLGPISIITTPTPGMALQAGSAVTVRGTSEDRGGGVVAVVEVSVDGGLTWHRASGTTNWTYTFTPRNNGEFTIVSRAVDDSVNIEVNGPRVLVNPTANPGTYSLWSSATQPGTIDSGDGNSVEVGMRFVSDVDGMITGLRFYKSAANTGTHVAHLWNASGTLLASATFTAETGSGWQQVNFATPVVVNAGATYVASYYAPNGHFSVDLNYFTTGSVSSGPLHGIAQGPDGTNGVYIYGKSAFPTQSYNGSNYWVDVVLNTNIKRSTEPPQITSFGVAGGTTQLTTDSAIVISFSSALNPATITTDTVQLLNPDVTSVPGGCCGTPSGWCSGCPLAAGAVTKLITATVSYDAIARTVTLKPTSPLATSSVYTVMVKGGTNGVLDLFGNPLASDTGATFLTPAQPASVWSNIWPTTTTPGTADSGDASAIEVGTKFFSDVNGSISGLRFYKAASNTGVDTINLWSNSGQLLATATVGSQTASGWQTAYFSSGGAITAGTTYVASYHTTSGHFSVNRNYFTSQFNSGSLHVPANGGVYLYGNGGFPNQTSSNSNYWVDVIMQSAPPVDNTAPTVASYTPAAGSVDVDVNPSISVTFSEAIDSTSLTANTFKLIDGHNNSVPATIVYNPLTFTATLTPSAPLANSTTYTILVIGTSIGVKDMAGNAVAQTVGGTFTTVASLADDHTPPTVAAVNPQDGATNVSPSGSFTVTFSEGVNAATINLNNILLLKNAITKATSTVTYNAATRTATITPNAPLDYAASYTIYVVAGTTGVRDLAGNAMTTNFVSSFMTSSAPIISSLWPTSTTPATVDSGDGKAVEVGVKFTATTNGTITGVRFYKSAANTGVHTGSLWSSSGQLLATGTFANETASGWQTLVFSTPVAITAGTTYTASYHTNAGHFSVTYSGFASAMTSGDLKVPANGGVYVYGAGGFPTSTASSSNYWVDVLLNTTPPADTTPPTVASITPASGTGNVPISSAIKVVFSETVNPATVNNSTVRILDGTTLVTATLTFDSATNTATITPVSPLSYTKTYTISVVGGIGGLKDVAGNVMTQTVLSTFTTGAPDTTAPTVTAYSPTNGAAGVSTTAAITISFSEALNAATVNSNTIQLLVGGSPVAATVTYNAANNTATLTPTAALAYLQPYTISVLGGANGVKDLAGNALATTATSSFTTAANTFSIWSSTTTPATVDSADTKAVEVGVKFTSNTSGWITGVEFYKSAANTGVHTGSLWSSSGQLLATGTFVNESASGWQTLVFTTPVAITAGTTYTASYHSNTGHYSVTRSGFTSALTSGMLTVPRNGGVYLYGAGYPTATASSSNYWVDVVFTTVAPPDTTPPTVTAYSPANGATGVATSGGLTVTFSEAVNASTVNANTVQLLINGTAIAATVTYNAANNTATLTPSSPLANLQTYTIRVLGGASGVKDVAGNALATTSTSSFTTIASTFTIWPTTTTPATVDSGETKAVELGVKFTSTTSGWITGVEFYKSAANTGVHTGSLWSASGQLLATGTFVNETASGWQTLVFSTPVAITAGTTYTASYHSNTGHFSVTRNAFGSALASGPLTVAKNGGVYLYGAGYPTATASSSNYWVDVVFSTVAPVTDTTAPSVTAFSPAHSTTNVATNSVVTVTFSEAMDPATINANSVLLMNGNTPTPATVTYNAATRTATLTPTGPLSGSATYTIAVLSKTVADLAGNHLGFDYSAIFTTVVGAGDTTPPSVVSFSPAHSTANVATSSTVTVTFSESMDPATINANSVLLMNGNTKTPATVTYNAATKTATLTPTGPLSNSATYTIAVLSKTVADLAGNHLGFDYSAIFTTVAGSGDTTPPSVVSFGPAHSTVNVATNSTVTVTFSEAMDPATINANSVLLMNGNTKTAATVTYDVATRTATLTPTGSLSNSTSYTIAVLSKTVADLAGNHLGFDYSAIFTTVAASGDVTPPSVVSFSPAHSSNNVTTSAVVTVVFSEAMDASTINANSVLLMNGAIKTAATVTYNAATKTATLTPTSPLANSTSYTIAVLSKTVADVAGNRLGFDYSAIFTTVAASGDVTPPSVVNFTPAHASTNVATNATVTVTFNEAMDASTINASSVLLMNGNTQTPATVTYNAATKTATLTPTGPLANSTVYTIAVLSKFVKDTSGNALAFDYSAIFTTV